MTVASAEILEENVKLSDEVAKLGHDVVRLNDENADLKLEVAELQAKLRFVLGQKFATSQSEKHAPLQGSLFNEAEATAELNKETDGQVTVGAHTRKRNKRKPLPEHLPRTVYPYDVPAEERDCPHGHGPMEKTGTTVSEQLEHIPARFRVLRHECATYGCVVCEAKATAKITAPEPLPGTMASPSLLAHVAVSKYCDHLPLYRQESIMARDGIVISRTTLATWMIKIAEKLTALMALLLDEIVGGDIVQMDETRIQVLSLPGKSAKSNSYMWVMVGGSEGHPVALFEFDPSRAGSVATRLLEDFSGHLQADAYGGYNAVCKRDDVRRVGCLMHIRRPFKAAHKQLKDVGAGEIAEKALAYIQALYLVEEEAKADPKAGKPALSPEARKTLRDTKSAPILADLHAFAEKHAKLVRPSSPTGEALSYCLNEWPNFIRFMEDGRLEIDNGRAERAIRPFAQGRRNWLFADTESGAKASATLFSLIETAKLNGREPRRYLEYVFARIGQATKLEDLEALLPWNTPPPLD